jgi:hypothetical protein
MTDELDPSAALVLLVGTLDSEGILSTLKAGGRQYKLKRLDSRPENWASIVAFFDEFQVPCTLVKLNPAAYENLTDPRYKEVRDRLIASLRRVPHVIFVYEALLSNAPDEFSPVIDPSSGMPVLEEDDEDADLFKVPINDVSAEVRRAVNEWLFAEGLNVLPYTRNAELTVLATSFITDTLEGLLFRVYVPAGRIFATETDKLLQLFRDYLARVGHKSVRLDQRRTHHGTVYEFFQSAGEGNDGIASKASLSEHFEDFSHLLHLCTTDPAGAEALLRSKSIPPHEVTQILTRYSKEARRLQVDLKHEREQKVLAIRHRLESELADVLPPSTPVNVLITLVEATVPALPTLGATLDVAQQPLQITAGEFASISVNYRPQIVDAVNSIVAQEIQGDVQLSPTDQQLLQLIQQFGGSQAPELSSAVRELADTSAPESGRLMARQRLKAFLFKIADRIGSVGFGLLQTYLAKRLGIS